MVREVRDFLAAQLYEAMDAGIAAERIILDPGIGFGKTLEHNLQLLRGLPVLAALGQPLLVGVSRKAFIGKILELGSDQPSGGKSRGGGGGGSRPARTSCACTTSRKLAEPRGWPTRFASDSADDETRSMLELIRQIRWQDLVDIGIITFLVYRSLQIVRGSRAMQMIIGLSGDSGRLRIVARPRFVYA